MARAVPACIWEFRGFESCLSLRDLCTLSLTQKDWQDPVIALYSSPSARQLVDALAVSVCGLSSALRADDSPNKLLHQLWRVVSHLQRNKSWGSALAAAPGLLYDYTQLFMVSDLPSDIKRYFVQHVGLKIKYQQMITAAYNRVAAVETWVRIQQELCIQTDMPNIIARLCCGKASSEELQWLEQWQPANPKDIVDMTQVVLNCSHHMPRPGHHQLAKILFSKIDDAAMVLHLLPTAVARGHLRVVRETLTTSAIQQPDAAAVLQLMQAGVTAHWDADSYVRSAQVQKMMELLVRLPAASYVARGDVTLLLKTALTTGNHAAVKPLCTLSAIKTSPLRSIVKLLKLAIKSGLDEAVITLCSLPAAKNISVHEWAIIAAAAMRGELGCAAALLCRLPAAAHAASGVVAELLSSAIDGELYAAAKALVSLPAAACIPPKQVIEVTQQLVTHAAKRQVYWAGRKMLYGGHVVDTLKGFGKLKAVQDMSSTELLELLSIAMQHGTYDPAYGWLGPTIEWLRELPAASSIPVDVIRQQMQEAVVQQNVRLLSALCQLPAAALVDADALLDLLDIAKKENSDTNKGIQRLLCKLSVHAQLSSSQQMAVLRTAVGNGQSLLELNNKMGWTKQLSTNNVIEFLSAAVKSNNSYNVGKLCSLPAAANIGSAVLAELISAALETYGSRASTLGALRLLPVAQYMPQEAAAALISKAEQLGDRHSVEALLPLQRRHSERVRCRLQMV